MRLELDDREAMTHENTGALANVKQERHDEHEINEIAAEMAEKNRQKMASQATQIALQSQTQASQQALLRAGGQRMITFYLQRQKGLGQPDDPILPPRQEEEKKVVALDEESAKGRFGWATVNGAHVPYLFRGTGDKFCAVRMVEMKLLNRYLNYLPGEITACIYVRSYFITETEAKLLNEINTRHCECQFGRDTFTTKDLVVRLADARCFHRFLDTCYRKLVQKSPEPSPHCGFVRINGESVVPYTVKGDVKYVPLFYFEGETDTLKLKADKIDAWELAYLKFCCKVQGIRNELFASDTCSVVSLHDVKQYFPKDTKFEDWWPQKTAEPLRVGPQTGAPQQRGGGGGNWTQRPPCPPPVATPQVVSHPVISTTVNKVVTPVGYKAPPQPVRPAVSAAPSMVSLQHPVTVAALNPMAYNPHGLYWNSLVSGVQMPTTASLNSLYTPDQLRRMNISNMTNMMPNISTSNSMVIPQASMIYSSSANTSTTTNGINGLDTVLRQLGYPMPNQATMVKNPITENSRNGHYQNRISTNNNMPNHHDKGPAKVPPALIPVTNGLRMDNISSHKGVGRNGVVEKQRLQSLHDVPSFRPDSTRAEKPYRARKIHIDSKDITCINHTAYQYGSDMSMVALQDVIRYFFPDATLQECIEVFQNVLTVTVFKANWHQVAELSTAAWGCSSAPDVVPLILTSDLAMYLSQVKYIFQHHNRMSQPDPKRLRTT